MPVGLTILNVHLKVSQIALMKLFANEDNPLQPGVAFKGYGKATLKSHYLCIQKNSFIYAWQGPPKLNSKESFI